MFALGFEFFVTAVSVAVSSMADSRIANLQLRIDGLDSRIFSELGKPKINQSLISELRKEVERLETRQARLEDRAATVGAQQQGKFVMDTLSCRISELASNSNS